VLSSDQERTVAEMMAHGFGAPFVFEPEHYRMGARGQKTTEPGDLMWWCRDTAILIGMTERAKWSAQRADDHNFEQLDGWLKRWKEGYRITGKNDLRSFDVSLADVKTLVLLSLMKVPEGHAWAWKEPDPDKELPGPLIRASLPQSVFERLALHGGSGVDLADYLADINRVAGMSRFLKRWR
jgi:hypothetical protein